MADRNTKIRGTQIFDGTIPESKLDIGNSPVAGYFLKWDGDTSKFLWVAGYDGIAEHPAGDINSSNKIFELSYEPEAGSLLVFLNGLLQEEGSAKDYVISSTTITFVDAPQTNDIIIVSYVRIATGGAGDGDMTKAVYDTDENGIVDKAESVDDGVDSSSASDIKDAVDKKHTQGSDDDLDATFEATFVKKADNANVLADITSTGAEIEDAVTKKHTQGTDTALGTLAGDIDMGNNSISNITNVTMSGDLKDGSRNLSVDDISTGSLQYVLDGGGGVISTGIAGDLEIPFGCEIIQVSLLGDQTGSIQVDIWKDTYANYPPTDADSITAGAVPAISGSTKYQDATLTGWTKTLSAGDILRFNVDSIATITRCVVSLKVKKT